MQPQWSRTLNKNIVIALFRARPVVEQWVRIGKKKNGSCISERNNDFRTRWKRYDHSLSLSNKKLHSTNQQFKVIRTEAAK